MKTPLFHFIVLIFIFILLTFFSRWIFTETFDLNYLEDLYFDSQWKNAFSKRIISDNELYQYAGYRYLKGENLFNVNPEVPPLGKYFYGLSIILFNNPYIISPIVFILTIIIFYHLCKEIFNNENKIFLSLLFFITSPLIVQQIFRTMLDIFLLLFFLIHLYANMKISQNKVEKKNLKYIFLSGISLGFFAASKFPVFIPLILIADLYYFYQNKNFKIIIPILFISLISYVLTFSPYFLQGHSIIEWIKSELWTINFYRIGSISNPFIEKIQMIFLGRYINLSEIQNFQNIETWSFLWPITIVIIIFQFLLNKLKNKNISISYLQLLFIEFLVFFLIFSFNARYFLLPLVLGIIILVYTINTKILKVFLILEVIQLIIFLRPTPINDIKFITQNWQGGYFKDLYFQTDLIYKNNINWQKFYQNLSQNIDYKPKVEITMEPNNIFENRAQGQIVISNIENNEFKFKDKISFIRINNKWKLVWKEEYNNI